MILVAHIIIFQETQVVGRGVLNIITQRMVVLKYLAEKDVANISH